MIEEFFLSRALAYRITRLLAIGVCFTLAQHGGKP